MKRKLKGQEGSKIVSLRFVLANMHNVPAISTAQLSVQGQDECDQLRQAQLWKMRRTTVQGRMRVSNK